MVLPHIKKVEKSILAPRPTRFLPTGLCHGHGVTQVLHRCREKETIVIESCVGTKGGMVVTRVLHGVSEGAGGALSL